VQVDHISAFIPSHVWHVLLDPLVMEIPPIVLLVSLDFFKINLVNPCVLLAILVNMHPTMVSQIALLVLQEVMQTTLVNHIVLLVRKDHILQSRVLPHVFNVPTIKVLPQLEPPLPLSVE